MAIPKLPFTFTDVATGWRRIAETINQLIDVVANIGNVIGVAAAGVYEATFLSGSIQYNDNGALGGGGDFQFGRLLPNASGTPCIGILLGGAGATQCVYITDEQLPGSKGITVIHEAGDASATGAGTDDGGDWLSFGGGTVNGGGGQNKVQGGTSVNALAGDAELAGGNATGTNANAQAGNAIVSSGQVGKKVGIGVILSANTPAGATGVAVIRHQFGRSSTVLSIDEFPDGSLFLYDIPGHATRNGFGLAGQALVSGGPGAPTKWLTGFTGTEVIGGKTYTWASGILVSVV